MGTKESNFVSAVIYVHNAEKQVGKFVRMIVDVLSAHFEKFEIICVNDSSQDASIAEIKALCSTIAPACVSIVNMSYFHGVELSMTAGTELAIGDFVFEFDATVPDFKPEEIIRIYRDSLEGFDIVSASPDRTMRRSSWLFYTLFNQLSSTKYRMTTERFRILSRRAINRVSEMSKTVPYRKPLYAACGLKTKNITYTVTERSKGTDDPLTRKYRRNLAADSLILFTNFGYKVAMLITSAMLLLSVSAGVYAACFKMLKNPVPGWTSTILFLSVSMFFVFLVLTIVLKYLQIIVNLIFRKAQYTFESIEKLSM